MKMSDNVWLVKCNFFHDIQDILWNFYLLIYIPNSVTRVPDKYDLTHL